MRTLDASWQEIKRYADGRLSHDIVIEVDTLRCEMIEWMSGQPSLSQHRPQKQSRRACTARRLFAIYCRLSKIIGRSTCSRCGKCWNTPATITELKTCFDTLSCF